jgi:hypothetical protein
VLIRRRWRDNRLRDVTVAVVIITLLDELEIPTSRILHALEHHPDLKSAPGLARKYWPPGDVDNATDEK